jgi:hypothetical protein
VIGHIYVENGVGKAVLHTVNLFQPHHGVLAVWQHDEHPQMQRAQNGDEWWITDVTARGMAILTQDRAILDDGPERECVKRVGAHLLALGDAHYTTWNKMRAVVNNWDLVERVLRAPGPAAATLWLSKGEWETF